MSSSVPIENLGHELAELIGKLSAGDEIILTSSDLPVARIIPSSKVSTQRRPGICKGMLVVNGEDESHLADFEDYR